MGDLSDAVEWWDASQLRFLVLASLGIQYFLTFFAAGPMLSRYMPSPRSLIAEIRWPPRMAVVTWRSRWPLYVFCKSWSFSADNKLLVVAILIFIPGILKCFAKPLGLKLASFKSFADSFDLAERTTTVNREEVLQKYVQEARNFVLDKDNESSNSEKLYVPQMLFVDFAYNYSSRLTILKSFCGLDDRKAYRSLVNGLSDIFDLLYTKKSMHKNDNPDCTGRDWSGIPTYFLSLFLPIVSIVFFHISHKKAYRTDDVAITGVLLYSTFVLEFCSAGILGLFESEWPDTVSQRSIMGQFAHNKRNSKLMSFATLLRCKDLLDQHWSMESCHSAKNITELMRIHVQEGWKDYITDVESYLEFNDMRGQWTLEREECHGRLNWSLEKPFDESILIWHIATDLCFHHMGSSLASSQTCREMSNYMMHLMVANPEMLMPGSRRSLFAIACNELEDILKDEESTLVEEDYVAKQVIDKVKYAQDTITKETFIYDAWVLAEGLMDLGGDKTWKVVQGVWLEMMCFSAGRCRGFLHAKALGTGGEFLSYVWLALAYSGMETFPERLQRTKKLHLSVEKRKHLLTRGQHVASPSASLQENQALPCSISLP
ncbi:hypothetical protein QYE76_047211 [Lolium multiflorum]|uniref:DUF4220 domain-containing protein n=1 Tax=Lolium multiflorum TaxID=4521 RepID=A0AAD8TRF0_LOLMU|nr:hypothetical protein QYE76_047211 [Lolium multiflorum]